MDSLFLQIIPAKRCEAGNILNCRFPDEFEVDNAVVMRVIIARLGDQAPRNLPSCKMHMATAFW